MLIISAKKHLNRIKICDNIISASKKSTRFWTGMPFARKSKIFGLHSIPVGTHPSVLEK